ncbi:hypothetical protein [Methylobacterium brachythecii]|uniref:Phospholipase A2 domain-containing protein n=1 Tax=Methylobacterium brachythecii TaxID=1176177 RepID=A0A7W6F5U8_9HYPH|nr:hypothetical protein [Methylobacterium brachythecii]MBB3901684.1 hypothetical protein [Methylobacterium brachythecii]GLS43958.1 hypothetical protein GCM10007884_19440 [Methylobacterium brachythecii]
MAFIPLRSASRRFAMVLALSSAFAGTATLPSLAQDLPRFETPDIDTPDVDEPSLDLPDTKGALVFHGNYCGPGSRGVGRPPVDALDEACMHHDTCSPKAGTGLPSCGCNARLAREASLVAQSPRTDDEQRVAAEFVAAGAKVLACR